MIKGFKDFLLRGNVIDLSVAVVIGAAFTDVVTAFTNSFLKPLIQLLSPGVGEFAGTIHVDGVVFDYATVINQTITFIITAAVVYFCVVAPMKAIQARRARGEEAGPAQPTDVELLTQIRDLLELQTGVSGNARPERLDAEEEPLDERVPAAVGAAADAASTRPVLPVAGAPQSAAMPRWARTPADAATPAPTRPAPPRTATPPQPYAEVPTGYASEGRHSRT